MNLILKTKVDMFEQIFPVLMTFSGGDELELDTTNISEEEKTEALDIIKSLKAYYKPEGFDIIAFTREEICGDTFKWLPVLYELVKKHFFDDKRIYVEDEFLKNDLWETIRDRWKKEGITAIAKNEVERFIETKFSYFFKPI